MLQELRKRVSPKSFEKIEDQQAAQILIVIIAGAFVTCLFTLLGGYYWKDASVVRVGGIGMVLMGVPLGLYVHKHLNASTFFIGVSVLVIVTVGATFGQGIHDISIMGFPVIVLIASLLMNRLGFIVLSFLSAASLGWLVYGEAHGLFVPHSTLPPSLADFIIMASILVVAALIVNVQARNTRSNLNKAQQEILRRKKIEEQLRYLGTHDILTGLYNRLFFDGELTRLEDSRSYPISVIIADLDNLKQTNDTLGHDVGDELLRRASSALHLAFRAGDILARIGGDEFAVLLPSIDQRSAATILSRIQGRIDEINRTQPDLHLQLSFGAATAEKGDLSEAFRQADKQMYKAKAARKAGSETDPAW
jgi:diguanylate cyclase (GGDEF)-like protein